MEPFSDREQLALSTVADHLTEAPQQPCELGRARIPVPILQIQKQKSSEVTQTTQATELA